ncbi:carcinine hydrolase/isopenicillin-N N-acyltransferase family protein [Bremerella sp. JC817]|uniref:carcinine hydrolase/isopenicillin-N N-acyltransferase family protein n=1 Tax=Bremerella sp. JC817 TaxID=3231756 RepID=UPI0034592BFD
MIVVRWFIGLVLVAGAFAVSAEACTTVIVSGKATPDGRPLLWKNRDFWQPQNEIVYSDRGQYAFVGIANAEATRRMRMGSNTAGFCIENSTSRDLEGKAANGPTNGDLITLALESCETVADFQALLDRTNATGRMTRGNFGVIDAHGGAMLFEVGPTTYQAFDTNDPNVAPQGFIVRSNFSETARQHLPDDAPQPIEDMYSGKRYRRAHELCLSAHQAGTLDMAFLLQQVCRDVEGCHASAFNEIDSDANPKNRQWITGSTLNRNSTVAAAVFQGVAPGEDPRLVTMWSILGEPMFSIAIPCWAAQGGVATAGNGPGKSSLCLAAMNLRQAFYDSSGTELQANKLDQVTSSLKQVEQQSIARIAALTKAWRKSPPTAEVLRQQHDQASELALATVTRLASDFPPPANLPTEAPTGQNLIDFPFGEKNGTRLGSTTDVVTALKWSGGLTDCRTHNGSLRIGRNDSRAATRYATLSPPVRVRSSASHPEFTPRGWLVAEITGWNLTGSESNERFRFGLSSQPENALHTAGVELERISADRVRLSGKAFGNGSTAIEGIELPSNHPGPMTLVLQIDKIEGNPDEGEFGGEYRIFLRDGESGDFVSVGSAGRLRRHRNGNAIHLQTAGSFADPGEYFDLDRIYFTTQNPLVARP